MVEKITEEMNIQDSWYAEAKTVATPAHLAQFVTKLINGYAHDYGTQCHAVAAAALAAAQCAKNGAGLSGFQAGAVQWEVIKHFGVTELPAKILSYHDLLYPSGEESYTTLSGYGWEWLQAEAKKSLAENVETEISPQVWAHWKGVADGKVPFGMGVRVDDKNPVEKPALLQRVRNMLITLAAGDAVDLKTIL